MGGKPGLERCIFIKHRSFDKVNPPKHIPLELYFADLKQFATGTSSNYSKKYYSMLLFSPLFCLFAWNKGSPSEPTFPGVAIPKTRGGPALQNLSASNFLPAQELSRHIYRKTWNQISKIGTPKYRKKSLFMFSRAKQKKKSKHCSKGFVII